MFIRTWRSFTTTWAWRTLERCRLLRTPVAARRPQGCEPECLSGHGGVLPRPGRGVRGSGAGFCGRRLPRGGRKAVSQNVYPDMEEFYHDLGVAYAGAVQAFADAGCRYLQLDETNLAYLCGPEQRQNLAARGDDPYRLPGIYARMLNTAIENRPPDMAVTMHLCRGNFLSSWIAQGGYEPIAELLFNGISVNGYFMEFDTERAGGFEPLRFVPKGKTVVLGLVTSKSGQLESKDEIKRGIDQATKYMDLDQLCLSPQCGFASTEEGNVLAEDEQMGEARAHCGGCSRNLGLEAPAPPR